MCRMLLYYAMHPETIPYDLLYKFIKSCHWNYFKRYDLVGHHGAGWGFAYLPINKQRILIKRSLHPNYHCKWQDLTKIKTRLLLIHARKTIFGEKKLENVHPIDIRGKYALVHNGTIKMSSFPRLKNNRLQMIQKNTDLDTRRYLCTILDNLETLGDIKDAIEATLQTIHTNSAANAFLFNSEECHIIKHQNTTFNGRHTTLFIEKTSKNVIISTTPLSVKALEIPNKSLISISNSQNKKCHISMNKLYA
ncbi:MAG: hypothetical protein BAJALOKI1v1_630011 [Promethearchaeota archaeon]|nr:MAG: hypothetical protein BAJALOKI1v1_630011 [Candidatus Lokiarchaeota archaeon]